MNDETNNDSLKLSRVKGSSIASQNSVLLLAILVGIGMICFTVMVVYGVTDMSILGVFGTGIITGITAIASLTQIRD